MTAIGVPTTGASSGTQTAVRNVALMASGAALVGLTSQILIPLPFTPVPVSLGTLGVLMVGGILGARRGAGSLLLFLLAGVLGVPWFASWESGWSMASMGYVFGYVVAAYVIGRFTHRQQPSVGSALTGSVLASLSVYAFGIPWLMISAGLDLMGALALGLVPFLLGDALKLLTATATLSRYHKRRGGN